MLFRFEETLPGEIFNPSLSGYGINVGWIQEKYAFLIFLLVAKSVNQADQLLKHLII